MSGIKDFIRDLRSATKINTKEELEEFRKKLGLSKEYVDKVSNKVMKRELRLQKKRELRK